MKGLKRALFWTLILSGFGLLSIGLWRGVDREPLPVIGTAPSFQLTSQADKTFALQNLGGKVWVGAFIFTRCAGPCPVISARMKDLQDRFQGAEGFHLISFSVDPDYDQPEVLRQYADRFKADPDVWTFLTGQKEGIHEMARRHFYLGTGDVPEDQRIAPDQVVWHSSKMVLIDGKAQIRGYYASEDLEDIKRLERDIGRLLKEGS